jgi:hypothetical protein
MKTTSSSISSGGRGPRRNEFCDKEPCTLLQKFVLAKLTMLDKESGLLSSLVLPNPTKAGAKQPVAPYEVIFHYCPFCGTRLLDNEDVIEWLERRIR